MVPDMNASLRSEMNLFNTTNLAAEEMQRQAALTLYGMSEQDRAWILERLPQEHVIRLRSLLGELRNLGLPTTLGTQPNRRQQQFFSEEITTAPELDDMQEVSTQEKIEMAGAATMFQLLKDAPSLLIVLFVQSFPWSWREEFIDFFELIMKRKLKEAIKEAEHPSSQLCPRELTNALWDELVHDIQALRVAKKRTVSTKLTSHAGSQRLQMNPVQRFLHGARSLWSRD